MIRRGVCNLTARSETPENVPPSIVSTTILLNVLVPVSAVTLPCTSPNRSELIIVAEKPPTEFLATTVPIIFSDSALIFHVVSNAPLNSDPMIKSPAFSGWLVEAEIVISLVPLNATELIVLAVSNLLAESALPFNGPEK